MKAQFATIEALVSLALVASTVSFAYAQLNGANSAYASGTGLLHDHAAAYDVLNVFARNATANACLGASLPSLSSGCLSSLLSEYGAVLHVGTLQISASGPANSTCGEIRLMQENVSQYVCVAAGG